jgi:hypothetical protein
VSADADRRDERLIEGGADLLSLAETTVLVVADDPPGWDAWRHPVWALSRSLAALGFGAVHLHGAESLYYEFQALMAGVSFTHRARHRADAVFAGEPFDVVLHLGGDPDASEACAALGGSRSSWLASLSWGETWVSMTTGAEASSRGPGLGATPCSTATPCRRSAASRRA